MDVFQESEWIETEGLERSETEQNETEGLERSETDDPSGNEPQDPSEEETEDEKQRDKLQEIIESKSRTFSESSETVSLRSNLSVSETDQILVIVCETTFEKTKLTLDSLFSDSDCENLSEIDYEIPISSKFNESFQIFTFGVKHKFGSVRKLEDGIVGTFRRIFIMDGGFYSVPYQKLNEITKGKTKPTLFRTIPKSLNFRTENAFMLTSFEMTGKLLEMSLNGEIEVSEDVIGIDKQKFMRFPKMKELEKLKLSPIRTAFALQTEIKYCFRGIDQMRQLSRARYSINLKFPDLKKSLTTKITNDKTINNYIKLLRSFENSCSKNDYVFFCMMNIPELYEESVKLKIFLPSLMEIDPNRIGEKTIYDLLVDFTLFDPEKPSEESKNESEKKSKRNHSDESSRTENGTETGKSKRKSQKHFRKKDKKTQMK